MDELSKINFKITINENKQLDFLPALITLMEDLEPGEYTLDVSYIPSSLAKAKRKYFALVDELGAHIGYNSKEERELFKEQVKVQLGKESIADMTTMKQVGTKIEELYKLAAEMFDYQFKPYEP